jgi:hypothetical protein
MLSSGNDVTRAHANTRTHTPAEDATLPGVKLQQKINGNVRMTEPLTTPRHYLVKPFAKGTAALAADAGDFTGRDEAACISIFLAWGNP